jgi:hypothetical protein
VIAAPDERIGHVSEAALDERDRLRAQARRRVRCGRRGRSG